MKFTTVLAVVAAATVVSAETNAARLARGLGPNAPVKRTTPALMARGSSPSGSPGQCNTGPVQCCNSVQKSGQGGDIDKLLGVLGIATAPGTMVGASCSPITLVGTGSGSSCQQQPVCCENNSYNGLINIGCSPININL